MYTLPLFPLNSVLLPHQPLPLRIFEERYKLMLSRCLAENSPFGVVLIRSGDEVGNADVILHPAGCTARIIFHEMQEDGTAHLLVIGEERFSLLGCRRDLPYLVGEVESRPLGAERTLDILPHLPALRSMVMRYARLLHKSGSIRADPDKLSLPDDSFHLLYLAAAALQISELEKQRLLEAPDIRELFNEINRLYRRELAIHKQITAR